jgi:hypothetical protein
MRRLLYMDCTQPTSRFQRAEIGYGGTIAPSAGSPDGWIATLAGMPNARRISGELYEETTPMAKQACCCFSLLQHWSTDCTSPPSRSALPRTALRSTGVDRMLVGSSLGSLSLQSATTQSPHVDIMVISAPALEDATTHRQTRTTKTWKNIPQTKAVQINLDPSTGLAS